MALCSKMLVVRLTALELGRGNYVRAATPSPFEWQWVKNDLKLAMFAAAVEARSQGLDGS
jgi:hypothetical protein